MKRMSLTLLMLAALQYMHSQITINNTLYTPTQLVDGILVPAGNGTTISNVTFSGVYNNSNRYQVGYFTTATTTLAQMGFSSGVVLSTGNTSNIPLTLGQNPQAAAQMSTNFVSCTAGEIREGGTCPTVINDVNILAGAANYYNAAILEFDFVPVSNVVQFRYIFGSEEYTDNSGLINYQCSSYNDKFGFLISGPGIAGGQGFTNNARNIARLANGSQVSINSVNGGTVGSSGGAPSASNCQSANPAWIQNNSTAEYLGTIDGTQLNGNTIILTAEQTGLTPGQTYHIKLLITDVNDGAYDAVVYLEAGSFTTLSCTDPTAPTLGLITQPTCATPTASVLLSGLPSVGDWTVTASPGGATLSGNGTSANFVGLNPATNYSFIVTNTGGCSSVPSANALINSIPSNPTAPAIGAITQPSCLTPTGSVILSGLPSTGTWTITSSPGGLTQTGTGTSYTFTGLASNTTYTFSVTNSAGCTSVLSNNAAISLYTPTSPILGAITQPTCLISSGTVALSGLPATGTWTVTAAPGGQTINSTGTTANFSGLSSGTSYTFAVTDNSGCISAASLAAVINTQPNTPAQPVLGAIQQPSCLSNTGSVDLSGLPASGNWTVNISPSGSVSGSGNTTTVTGLVASGIYNFTVTNSSGCTSTATLNAVLNAIPTAPSAPIVGGITQPSCITPTGSVDLSGLPAGNWTITASPGGLTQTGNTSATTFSGLSSNTTYSFTVTNTATSCTSVNSTNAVINLFSPTPPITGAIVQPTCLISTGSVSLSGLPSTGAWTVTASPSGLTLNSTGTTGIFSGLSSGTYTFSVTDNSGCISAASLVAIINAQPLTPSAPNIGAITQPNCIEITGSIEIIGLPVGNWTISANPGGNITGAGSTYTFTGQPANSSYTFTVTNDQGCASIASEIAAINAVPTAPNAPIIGSITQPTCAIPDGSVELSGLPSTGNWTVTANPGGIVLIGSGSTGTFIDLSANTTYTFSVTDLNGCISLNSLSATINPIPNAPASPTASVTIQPTCALPTGTLEITLPLGTNFIYSLDGINFQASPIFAGLTPGIYSVYVENNSTSCISNETLLTVNAVPNAPDAPIVNITAQPTCLTPTGSVEIVSPIGANFQYTMTNGGSIIPLSTTSVGLLNPGQTYSFTVTDINTGCNSSSFDVTLNNIPVPETVDAGADYTINLGESATLTASGNGSLVWENGDITSTTVSPTVSTTYVVTLTDANGCTDTDFATVYIAIECGDLFVPTAFTPNGDNMNSQFRIKINPSCVEEMSLKVYDRWGEVIFQTESPSGYWDGKYKDKELDSGVFVYTLDIKLNSDTAPKKYSGNVTLIK
ncbi:MAG: gliding motility-associated C-terminal domain-containing protein [Crocinitomicaceae bacterium]|nr:gliding motility-associated C-terminal domain-containing protein [Crocinitomicaceae bacterium]